MSFVPLHVHSEYSLLDGSAKLLDLVNKAKEEGMPAMALTDHGSMYGVIEFYQKATKAGIKPIIGVEAYVAPNGRKNKRAKIDEDRYHLILLAKNNQGYQNLLKLVTLSYLEGFYYKPRMDFELLEKYSEGLIASSACLQGEISVSILSGKSDDQIDQVINKYVDVFGKEDFYLEVQHHPSLPEQAKVNEKIYQLAKKHGVRVIATNDTHYLNSDDDKAHDILLCIQMNRHVNEENRISMVGDDFSFKTIKQMKNEFADHPEVLENTLKIAEKCNVELEFGKNVLPEFSVPEGETPETYLRKLCYQGLIERYEGQIQGDHWQVDDKKVLIESNAGQFFKKDILDRLEYELGVIEKTGFSAYFLIVADFINWAKDRGIVVGPGRGSAAGSIVAYLMKITNLDPLGYELLFERFLNPERISMPDIDIDFADVRREEVIRYVEEKYGKDHVAQIITFGTMAARAAIRDVGRALAVEYGYCDKLAKMIPTGLSLEKAMDQNKELKDEYNKNKDARNIIDNAKKLEGVARHSSIHACGILITPQSVDEYAPVQYPSGGSEEDGLVSQYSLHPVEDLGLLKMDFLGLKNLTIIQNTLEAIEKIHGIEIDIDNIPLDDEVPYKLLQKGETTGVFQLESSGMKRYLKLLKPTGMEDIIAMVPCIDRAPMDLIPEYISNKKGRTKPVYLHPKLEPILSKTHGIAIYQEQLMEIAKELAGFTLGEADVLRKSVGKKIKELLKEQKTKFIKRCVENNVNKKVAEKVFAFIEPFAGYGFNRSHAACYAYIAYQTAYLKSKYPAEFMASLMTADLGDNDRIAIEINECKNMGIEVLPPDVNESFSRFTVVAESLDKGEPRIRFGLGAIKNVGDHITKVIIAERKDNGNFLSLEDFLCRVKDKDLNKKSLEGLIKSGALDRFGDRNEMLMNVEKILKFIKQVNEEKSTCQNSLFAETNEASHTLILEKYPETEKTIVLRWEKEHLGIYLSEHPFADYQLDLDGYILSSKKIRKTATGSVRIAGVISTIKKNND